MGIEIRQLHPLFVGEVSGMDLSRPLDGAGVRALWEAIDRYAVLVFHDQRVSDKQLRDFAGKFGKLEIGRSAAEGGKRRLALPEIGDISNLDEEGRLRTRDDRRRLDSLGNRIWHTDASYMPVPVVLGMLHAVAVPPPSALGGGETEFADMRAAYDALPETMKEAIDGLVAEHDVFWSRGQIGFTNSCPASARSIRPPDSGWCALTRAHSARPCTCRRTPRTSSAGVCPRVGSCSTISICTPPGSNSSTATNGGSGIS
jgi:alpha-ketoglutarate-dependent 2,4-dichlorophenoxyacetate dioxygenase